MTHIESRPSKANMDSEIDYYVDCICPLDKKEDFISALRAKSLTVSVLSHDPGVDEGEDRGCMGLQRLQLGGV